MDAQQTHSSLTKDQDQDYIASPATISNFPPNSTSSSVPTLPLCPNCPTDNTLTLSPRCQRHLLGWPNPPQAPALNILLLCINSLGIVIVSIYDFHTTVFFTFIHNNDDLMMTMMAVAEWVGGSMDLGGWRVLRRP